MKIKGVIFLVALILMLVGCGGGGGGGDSSSGSSLKISGTIVGDGIVQSGLIDKFISRFVRDAYAADDRPDKIIVVSNTGEILNDFNINADGTFEIDFSQLSSNSFIMFVKNTVSNKYYGHIKLGTQNLMHSLDCFDKSKFLADVDLGVIDVVNLDGPVLEDLDVFSAEDKDLLYKMARNDDGMALYLNQLMNNDIESHIGIQFRLGSVASLENVFFDIDTFTESNLKGMGPLFYYSGSDAESLENVLLYPPSNIMYLGYAEGDTDYIHYADEFIGIEKSVFYNSFAGVVTIEIPYVNSFPEGYWILENNDTGDRLGKFVFAGASPFDENDHFKAFLPVPKINTDSDGNVTSVFLKLYRYGDAGFERISKFYFDSIAYDLMISVIGSSQISDNMNTPSVSDDGTEITFQYEGTINIDNTRFVFSYKIGQVKYQFFTEL